MCGAGADPPPGKIPGHMYTKYKLNFCRSPENIKLGIRLVVFSRTPSVISRFGKFKYIDFAMYLNTMCIYRCIAKSMYLDLLKRSII
jgi:hypothetical protein